MTPHHDPRHEEMRIAGEKLGTDARLTVMNPYSGDPAGSVPCAQPAHVRAAFQAADSYTPSLTRHARSDILRKTATLLAGRAAAISDLITAEAGICKKDSLYEVGRACDVFNLAAQLCMGDDGEVYSCDITPQGKKRKIFTLREPLRAISAITPFNHPLNQVAHKIAPAIATNNCMVLKPSEKTPLTALMLADILAEAGLPGPMFSVITGLPEEIGDAMLTDPAAELISFTGGVAVGKSIAMNAGYRRTVLELGGNDPLIVMGDADPERAAELAVAGAFRNSGQRCTAVKRILAVDSVADDLVAHMAEKTAAIRYGNPADPDMDMGTVIDEDAAILFRQRVEDALQQGAKLLCGHTRKGALYAPTLLDHVPPDCELVREESFGPVAPVIRCRDLEHVIRVANGTAYGLSSGVCTDNWRIIRRLIDDLRVGTVNVWEVPGYRTEISPFGGVKDSGLGYKEGVVEAMKSFTTIKTWSLPWE